MYTSRLFDRDAVMFPERRLNAGGRLGINGVCRPDCERSSAARISCGCETVIKVGASSYCQWFCECSAHQLLCQVGHRDLSAMRPPLLPTYTFRYSVCYWETQLSHTNTHTHTLRQQCWLLAAVLGEFLRNPRSLLLTEMFCNRVFLLKCISICAGKGEATANADIINQNGLGHIYRERKAKKNTHVTLNMISLHVSLLSKRQSWTSFVLNQLVSWGSVSLCCDRYMLNLFSSNSSAQ